MRPSKFTEGQITESLRQVKAGASAVQVCRDLGITQTTFYRWRKKYDVLASTEHREVLTLRVENRKLKEMVANLMLGKLP